jgi:hypothetical protein
MQRKKVFLAPSLSGLLLGERGALAERYLSRAAIDRAGVFDVNRITLIRAIARAAPQGSYWRGALENVLTAVLSVQVLHSLFCSDFPSAARRYRRHALGERPKTRAASEHPTSASTATT